MSAYLFIYLILPAFVSKIKMSDYIAHVSTVKQNCPLILSSFFLLLSRNRFISLYTIFTVSYYIFTFETNWWITSLFSHPRVVENPYPHFSFTFRGWSGLSLWFSSFFFSFSFYCCIMMFFTMSSPLKRRQSELMR